MAIKLPVKVVDSGSAWDLLDADGRCFTNSWYDEEALQEIAAALNAQADYPNTDSDRWQNVLERFEKLTGSVRDAQLKAMRLVVDALELKMKRMLEAGSAPGAASVLDELLSVAATDEQLLALMDESERE